ncbi:class I SAM-dependent rRNA methyltransferase [Candidatus Peregrinibacteria bacterium]|nr:class I SAM-dependent rRNA methyltransferase [Candidatus Peregrinibacteria bacterium]
MAQKYPVLLLRPDREIHLKNRHHAIYKNAVAVYPKTEDGSIVEVQASDGTFLCFATLNTQAYIAGRAISFQKDKDPLDVLRINMENAIAMRGTFFAKEDTTAYRLINAEGDGIPGLIVDRYNDTLVVQLTTLGMDRLSGWICDTLHDITKLTALYEKSSSPARKKEGLENREGWLAGPSLGKGEPTVEVRERGLKFKIDLEGGQKTGLFIDQREMRSLVRQLSAGRTVLDCCSYVGGFSLSALMGGAVAADAVDYDAAALERAKEHMKINDVGDGSFTAYAEDVFNFLRRAPMPRTYDFIILDPPAFAKRSSDLDQAKRAYTDMNRMAMQALPAGGMLLTCSCSYQIDHEIFQTIVFHAARQANRSIKILHRHRQAFDHPVSIFHPEADYLKSMLLWVE